MKTYTNGYPFEPLKTFCLPFVICFSSSHDQWDAVRTAILLKKIFTHSNGYGYPFEKNSHPFEWLSLSEMFIVWTAKAISSKKVAIHLNSWLRLFIWKYIAVQAADGICFNKTMVIPVANVNHSKSLKPFKWLRLSVWTKISIHLND